MRSADVMRKELPDRDRTPAVTKAVLALFFLLGIAVIAMGAAAQRDYAGSGFSFEAAYSAVHWLGDDAARMWAQKLAPQRDALSAEQREQADGMASTLLENAWESQKAGGAEEARALMDGAGAEKYALTYKLLYATYLMNGPTVSTSQRKAILAVPESRMAAFRRELLLSAADENAPVPEEAAGMVEKLSGEKRQAMLFQLFFVSNDSAAASEAVKTLKKSVRDKEAQLGAFRMIARNEISWTRQLIVGNSRATILVGVLLALDALALALLMMAEKNWRMDVKWLLILLIVDFLLYFQLLPMVYMVFKVFFPENSFTFSVVERLYTYSLNLDAMKNTLIAAFATMILGTLLAFPLAWLVGRTNLYGKKFFRSLFVLTYMVPPYVGAMAWMRLMNPNVGTINQWLRALFALGDSPGPLNVYTLPGMIWVLTTFYYPYAFITISRAMEKMDPSLEEASRISGASPIKTLFTVTLPMMTPSLIAGALLVFISAASCYGIPSIIGTQGNVNTVTTRIVEFVSSGQQGLNDATSMSVFLMAVALIVLFISDVVLAKKQYITVSGKSMRPSTVDLRGWRIPVTVLVSLFAVIVVLLPFATIFTTSFKVDVGKNMLAAGNFTTANWSTVFMRAETIGCLKNSLIFAAVAATVGLVIACVMSYLLQRTKIRGRTVPNFLITLGSGTPSVVIALGLIMTMRGDFGVNIYNTAYIIIIAYLIKYLMMGMRTVVSAMSQIHVSLEECSQVAGASWTRTMFKITGPLIFPSIAAGWFLIFIPCFYELSMTTLLMSSTTKTIGYQLYEYWTFTSQPMSCAMAFGILLIVVALNFVLNRLTKGEFSI